jgi:hypothetical protein
MLMESRIILLSSHTAMLHLAGRALIQLLYPLTWASIYIPVLPARLITALEAPCPYIVGVERRYENLQLPDEDFVCCDLDQNTITATDPPRLLPRSQRRKLVSLLQLAAPHHIKYGASVEPPAYAVETFPHDAFISENSSIFTPNAPPNSLAHYAGLNSTSFGESGAPLPPLPLLFNAFLKAKIPADSGRFGDRPRTNGTNRVQSPPSPSFSPTSSSFGHNFSPLPSTPVSRNDSGIALVTTLREKRSGLFDSASKRSSTHRFEQLRRPSMPPSHGSSQSLSTLSMDNLSMSRSSTLGMPASYAPSTYAASTLAPSTIMPSFAMNQVKNTEDTIWIEGHGLQWRPNDMDSICAVCEEYSDEGIYKCSGCTSAAHARCAGQICLVCPVAFHQDQVRAAFVRCFASLFYTYRKYLSPATGASKKEGKLYKWNGDGFLKSLPREAASYVSGLLNTQAFNEFIHDRESISPNDPKVRLFDQIILAKRNRGPGSLLRKSDTSYLLDISKHIWRSVITPPPNTRFPGEYRTVISRIPAKLDPVLMKPGKEQNLMISTPMLSSNTSIQPMSFEFGIGKEAAFVKATPTNITSSGKAGRDKNSARRQRDNGNSGNSHSKRSAQQGQQTSQRRDRGISTSTATSTATARSTPSLGSASQSSLSTTTTNDGESSSIWSGHGNDSAHGSLNTHGRLGSRHGSAHGGPTGRDRGDSTGEESGIGIAN